ncbi:MAG: rRNA maturation RNase YbeY [Deltaproteobacteria bacterium]|nr:rRNA maturation RNase YbeY [Deltaproteobacteria bacterium]
MQVWIRNDCAAAGLDDEVLAARAEKALAALGCGERCELSVWLCDDATIQDLHGRYLGSDTPTNVISFAQRDGDFADLEPDVLGDVVISVDTAARDAREAGSTLLAEVTFLLVHGILHLVGYDHEGEQAHRAPEMEEKEEELFRSVTHET